MAHDHDHEGHECMFCKAGDDPAAKEMAVQEFHAKNDERIEEHGFTIVGVFTEAPDDPSFAYSIGMAKHGLADMIIFGLPLDTMAQIVHAACEIQLGKMISDTPPYITDDLANMPAWVLPVEDEIADDYMTLTRRYNGLHGLDDKFAVIVWPDEAGHFFWEMGYHRKWLRAMGPTHLIKFEEAANG